MAYTPYQIAGSQSGLMDLIQQSRFGGEKSKLATARQMGGMEEEYEKEVEQAEKDARKRSKKNKGLIQGLQGLSMFLGPMGAAITGGLASAGQLEDKRQGAKLLKNVDKSRYEKTFLRKPMKAYWEEAEEAQMSSGDVLRGGIGAGLQGFMMSKMMGGKTGKFGEEGSGGIIRKLFKDTGKAGGGLFGGQKLFQGGIKEAFGNVKDISGGVGTALDKGGLEKFQENMMLPMLLQQLLDKGWD